jgi:arsenate reductase
LELIRAQGVEPSVIEYLNTPPTAAELKSILHKLGKPARDIVRRKEAQEEGIDVDGLSEQALIQALVIHPRAIERPIVVKDDKAALGRPPESVLDIL